MKINNIALTFLHNLKSLHILRIIENKSTQNKQKLSERFAGCISKERAEELQKELTQMRYEWNSICLTRKGLKFINP